MKITNEEIIYCLSEPCIDACFKCSKYGTDAYKFGDCREEVLKAASDIVQKYQKIEHIVRYDWGKGYQLSETINRIKEVMNED